MKGLLAFSIWSFFLVIGYNSTAQLPKKLCDQYELIWQDDFDGDVIDTSKWDYRQTGAKRGTGIVKEANCFLDGEGHLVIKATKRDSNYYIGQIATMNTQQFRYGYFECRAKLTKEKGTSCAFWLQSLTYGKHIGDPGKSGTEIDIFEYRTKYHTDEVHHTVHWDGYGESHQQKGKSPHHKQLADGDFHVFGLEWTEKKYTFYVDGKKSWSSRKAISQADQYIILSLEMNNWSGDPSNSTFPDQVVYDYVKVYKKKAD